MDFFLIYIPAYSLYIENGLSIVAFLAFVAPLILGELLVVVFSVMPGLARNRKIKFRLMRQTIKTKEENDAWWSSSDSQSEGTSDSEDEAEEQHKQKVEQIKHAFDNQKRESALQALKDKHVFEEASSSSTDDATEREERRAEDGTVPEAPNAQESTQNWLKKQYRKRVGGPYAVSLNKRHKPVFIAVVDLWFFLAVLMATLIYDYIDLDPSLDVTVDNILKVMPPTQRFMISAYFLKFILDWLMFVLVFDNRKVINGRPVHLNSSTNTTTLFFVRIVFDVLYLGFLQVYLTSLMEGDLKNNTHWLDKFGIH